MKHIFLDITDLNRTKAKTGIQRVVKEIYLRMIQDKELKYKPTAIVFNSSTGLYDEISKQDVAKLLDGDGGDFNSVSSISPENIGGDGDIFLDVDSAWNIANKRGYIYQKLKNSGVYIISYVYDLVPLKKPELAHENTVKNFAIYMSAVIAYADLVMCDSRSTEKDFVELVEALEVGRNIPTVVTMLGSDFKVETTERSIREDVSNVIKKKYIICVGTIEPRKRQDVTVKAFEKIAAKHPDLHLVIVGKKGWKSENNVKTITQSLYYGRRIHWFEGLDDYNVKKLYENAYISTYISEYEGFGLPVAEPLGLMIPTIASYNSSIPEVGGNYADYVFYNSPTELAETLQVYLSDSNLYGSRKLQLSTYSPFSWDKVYFTIRNIVNGFAKSIIKKHDIAMNDMQGVVISIDINKLKLTLDEMSEKMKFVSHFLLVTPSRLKTRAEIALVGHNVIIITDEELLGEELGLFKKLDHQEKNWLLRVSLMRRDEVEPNFIMFDDDNRPLCDIPVDTFVSHQGIYNGYYFYDIETWPHYATDYDKGQHKTARVLREAYLEKLSYSSHMPQVINKEIYLEMILNIKETGLDEWSMYFNYIATRYPRQFRKKVFVTMNWPARPSDWQHTYRPPQYLFENYYDHIYDESEAYNLSEAKHENNGTKIEIKHKQTASFYRAVDNFNQITKYISDFDIAHGCAEFNIDQETKLYVWGLPYIIATSAQSKLRLNLKYKIITKDEERIFGEIVFGCFARGYSNNQVRILHDERAQGGVSEGFISLPISSNEAGIKTLQYFVKLNGDFTEESTRYCSKLVVQDRNKSFEQTL